MANAYSSTKSMKNGILILIDEKISLAYSINIKKSMKNGNHKKRRSPLMIHAKTKFPDRALSCGNHTFLSYDCPAILQRGGEGSKFEVMTHKKDTEYSGAFCTSTLFLTFVDSNKSMRSVIFSSWMLLWEGVAFSFLSIMTESLLPLQAHNAPRAPPGPRAHRRRGAAKIS